MFDEIKQDILEGYVELGGCNEVFMQLMQCQSREDLLKVYRQHPSWCMELDFPPIAQMRKQFGDGDARTVFIDKEFNGETFSSEQVYIFHNCKGNINVEMDIDAANIPMLYFCNHCDIHVSCTQPIIPKIKIPLYIYGDNIVTTHGGESAEFIRHEHPLKRTT